ncbi:MAG TPA: FG-GAP-like repeat-containing protein, partial [Gaiellaceae bacterium]|nr:FG-GAP-like repeat-containing protein [Gaiellaceae bacterium]
TEHGDWWSMHGWWIFAGTSAVALLSKYVVRVRGNHVFNPSNFGLVLCFLLLGAERADPLALWWGPLSPALVLALVLIVAGGFLILRRLHLVGVAAGFWLAFAAGIGVLAASGHTMTAAWHVGPIEGTEFWWLLVSSPEILVFLFFMITDPKTIPASRGGRRAYAVAVGLLATLLIAPQTTEFATKVAILAALFVICAARGMIELVGSERLAALVGRLPRRRMVGAIAFASAAAYAGLVVAAGIPARPDDGLPRAQGVPLALPEVTVVDSQGVAAIDDATAQRIARDVMTDLRFEAEALERRDRARAADAAAGEWLTVLWRQIDSAAITAPISDVERIELRLLPGDDQGPPTVVARLEGTDAAPRTLELALEERRYRIVSSRGGTPLARPGGSESSGGLDGTSLTNVAPEVGLSFRHGAFRFGMSNDTTAMMGAGLCWLDYDSDGWLDLFVVNSYVPSDTLEWEARGGLPRSALYRNVRGRFEDVSARAGADLPLRGNGCVAADLDLDGHTDLYVTSAGYNVETDGYDALLWNEGDGSFTEGARVAGLVAPGWHAGAAVGDVNEDGLPDLFVAGYTDPNIPNRSTSSGFPTNYVAVRDLLYLNQGVEEGGRPTFREIGKLAGVERMQVGHGLGAVMIDYDLDGRLDLYVANDADPNQLYRNVPSAGGGLGFRLEEVAKPEAVDDPNAGMGIAAADFSFDGRTDLFVTNSRGQLHASYRSRPLGAGGPSFADARPELAAVLGARSTGWGTSWADLDLDGDLDLVVANGAIPVVHLARDAQRVQVLANLADSQRTGRFARAGASVGLQRTPSVNGRGLAAADFDNDGDVDVAVNSIGGELMLLRNDGRERGHWLTIRLRSFAPGAVVTVVLENGRRLVRQVLAGSSYLSSEDPRVHFGLGKATRVERLTVRFPNGKTAHLGNVAADRVVDVAAPR